MDLRDWLLLKVASRNPVRAWRHLLRLNGYSRPPVTDLFVILTAYDEVREDIYHPFRAPMSRLLWATFEIVDYEPFHVDTENKVWCAAEPAPVMTIPPNLHQPLREEIDWFMTVPLCLVRRDIKPVPPDKNRLCVQDFDDGAFRAWLE